MKPKKHLGQNFLINKEKIKKIVEALEVEGGDTILEIGPGHGELTREILKKSFSKLIAIERDSSLADLLKNDKFLMPNAKSIPNSRMPKIEILEGDVLKILPSLIHNSSFKIQNYKLVGNIPYYITGFLLRIMSELEKKPKIAVLTVQKEVAERIIAESPRMNLLAASVQFWAMPEIVGLIPRENFSPQPKVDSAIIRLRVGSNESGVRDTENYYKLIKILFKQPRKTVLNNLIGLRNREETGKILERAGVKPDERPQNLSISQIRILAEKTARSGRLPSKMPHPR